MDNQVSLTEWVKNFNQGKYSNPSTDVQIEAGWYDWFCKDTSLKGRLMAMAPKVKKIAQSKKIDPDKVYVFFKNCCPVSGNLYDQFKICSLETHDVIYCFNLGCCHDKSPVAVYGKVNQFETALVKGTWKEVLKYFFD